VLDAFLWVVATPLGIAGIIATVSLPSVEVAVGRGRHVSRPLVRRVGPVRAFQARCALLLILFASFFAGDPTLPLVAIVWNAWIVDDWLYRDDDDRKLRYEWARVRIRMPKPVRLRPVERTAPA
jgi:hypothetical protein